MKTFLQIWWSSVLIPLVKNAQDFKAILNTLPYRAHTYSQSYPGRCPGLYAAAPAGRTTSLLHIPTPYYLTTSDSNTIQPHYFTFQHHTTSLLRIPTPYNLTTSHSNKITHYIHIPPCKHACSDGRRCKEHRMFTDIHGCVGVVPWVSVAMTIAIVVVARQGHGASVTLRVNPLR